MKKKIINLFLVFVFIFLTGCSGKNEPEVKSQNTNEIKHSVITLFTRINEFAYVSSDIKKGVNFTEKYWDEKNEIDKTRKEDFKEKNLISIKKIQAVIKYAEEKGISISDKDKEDVKKYVAEILSSKDNNFLNYCKMYNYRPEASDLEEVYGYYVLEKNIKNGINNKQEKDTKVDKAVSLYEIKIPVKIKDDDDYEKSLTLAKKISEDVINELKNDEPVIEVASKFAVAAYPKEYNNLDNKEDEEGDYISKAYESKNNDVIGPYEVTKDNEVKYILIAKISEENSETLRKRITDIKNENLMSDKVDEEIDSILKNIKIDEKFIDEIELKSK